MSRKTPHITPVLSQCAHPVVVCETPDANKELAIASFENRRIAPLLALSTILAEVPRQNALTPPPSLYTFLNASSVDSVRNRPIRVFQTSKGIPKVAASTH